MEPYAITIIFSTGALVVSVVLLIRTWKWWDRVDEVWDEVDRNARELDALRTQLATPEPTYEVLTTDTIEIPISVSHVQQTETTPDTIPAIPVARPAVPEGGRHRAPEDEDQTA